MRMRVVNIKVQYPEGRTDSIFLYLINIGDRDMGQKQLQDYKPEDRSEDGTTDIMIEVR